MGGKEIVECQPVNGEGMMELENHYLTAIIVITALGKNHQWVWKPVGKSFWGTVYFHSLKVSSQKNYLAQNYFS